MKQQAHQEIYRVAYESANAELIEINEEFDRLRARMGQIESLVAVLKPLVFEKESEPVVSPAQENTTEPVEASAEPLEKDSEPAKFTSDPFQHRVNHILGIGAGIRDVRSYTRTF